MHRLTSLRSLRRAARSAAMLAILPLSFLPASSAAQETDHAAGQPGLNLGAANSGLSIGASRRWNGIRINWSDRRLEEVLHDDRHILYRVRR